LYKIIFDSVNSTFDQIINNDQYYNVLNSKNFIVQSFVQKKGTGRGTKKWSSPKGNIYITINQKCHSKEILKNSFLVCHLIHKFFLIKYSLKLQYKWPNDLYFDNKKLIGVVSKSKIISDKAYIQVGIGINVNNSPLKLSVSLSQILSKKFSIYNISNDLIDYLDYKLKLDYSNEDIVKYLNIYLMKKFKLKHPKIQNKEIKILKVENNLSLLIDIEDKRKNIFFGELI
jgi:BirA family biotin operon repressor/biotin-[acetyl-CoA-carboxylase] ligase